MEREKEIRSLISLRNELIEWIRDYFKVNGPDSKAVVGISGGKDSSVVAALCVAALGKERVYGVLMPKGEQDDIQYSYDLCKHLDIQYSVINIGAAVDALLNSFTGLVPNENTRINVPARVRMTTLYAVASIVGGRVANTCNLSEDFVGYATKYGDGAGDFSPLSHLTVGEVKVIGLLLGLPTKFIEKTPIDGLCGMSDEESLGFTYSVLDKYIRTGECEDLDVKLKIIAMNVQNQHKLQLMPAFGASNDTLKELLSKLY